jgi:hypothetical protein
MIGFTELSLYRRGLRTFCAKHIPSIEAFRSGVSYSRELPPEPATDGLRHLTSTATCLESLGETAECPQDLAHRWREFSEAALKLPPESWKSDGTAGIYCRCRALPLLIGGLDKYDKRVEPHVETILKQLEALDRFAIGEADPEQPDRTWYPPNAFHTYWALSILNRLERRFPECPLLPSNNETVRRQYEGMLVWARQVLGAQTALHNGNSTALDTDQLVWSLACVLQGKHDRTWALGDQDLIRQALAAIFSTQTEIGNWPKFQPLFHYPGSGNAYCYIFETLNALLRAALQRDASFLRAQLKGYCDNFVHLWKYAESTAIPNDLPTVSTVSTWSSGHRSHASASESWATASVYSFAQLLRRVVGIWTRETALKELNHIPLAISRKDAEEELKLRGKTWSARPVSQDLFCLFVNPVKLAEANAESREANADPDSLDPDRA